MKRVLAFAIVFFTLFSCVKENNTTQNNDDFNRTIVLDNWVNNIIIPAYTDFDSKITALKAAQELFVNSITQENFTALQTALLNAQKSWQYVAMFDLGNDPNATASFRSFINTFPANSNELTVNLNTSPSEISEINFDLSTRADQQGFSTLDFLLNGTDIEKYTNTETKDSYIVYLTKVVDRIQSLTTGVVTYWNTNKNSISNDGGRSGTAAFNVIINDYLFYVEQGFREAKIATPSGFRTGGADKNAAKVESYYSPENSKLLFEEALKAVKNFYFGISFNGSVKGAGVDAYLADLNPDTLFDGVTKRDYTFEEFVDLKFSDIDNKVILLDANLATQVTTDNKKMTDTFIQIQNLVVFIKTNVFSTLSVGVDFVDGDSD